MKEFDIFTDKKLSRRALIGATLCTAATVLTACGGESGPKAIGTETMPFEPTEAD